MFLYEKRKCKLIEKVGRGNGWLKENVNMIKKMIKLK